MNRITYISESTRQLMQGSAEVQELASVAYRTAVSLEEKLHRFSLLTSSIAVSYTHLTPSGAGRNFHLIYPCYQL